MTLFVSGLRVLAFSYVHFVYKVLTLNSVAYAYFGVYYYIT